MGLLRCLVLAVVTVVTTLACTRAEAMRVSHFRAIIQVPGVQDTVFTRFVWVLPNDGKGSLDSITVDYTDFSKAPVVVGESGSLHTALPPTTTSAEFRQPLPWGDATWDGAWQVCTWRSSSNPPACVEGMAPLARGRPAPLPVSNVTVTQSVITVP